MEEKLKFRSVSKLKVTESEERQDEIRQDASKQNVSEQEERKYIDLSLYDVSLDQISLSAKPESLNTDVKEVVAKQTSLPLFDVSLTKHDIEPEQILSTDLAQVHTFKETFKIADIKLFDVELEKLSSFPNTDIMKNMEVEKSEAETLISPFNLELESKTLLKQSTELDTELVTANIESGLEVFASFKGQARPPIFEEFINCDERFPRSFSESFNSPFIVLIGEDKYDWHIPIIYALKELFCEITDKHPRITFREPEVWEEGMEELVDSIDPHSLDQFAFEYKIELLDARKMSLAVDEFAKAVKGRLKSAFLQQFGVLVVAVKQRDLKKADILKRQGLHVYTSSPDNVKEKYETFCSNSPDNVNYEKFCSKILGVSTLDGFFSSLRNYEKHLGDKYRKFSIFVKRGDESTDKLQYPLKVAIFVYLLNDLKNRRKRTINNFEEICGFVNEILEKEIKVESPILEGKVIPDLIYTPEKEEIYVEIETLIGNLEPLKKIDETIEKYREIPNAVVWVILKPVSAIIHYEELKSRKKAYGILYKDRKIEFKVLILLTSKDKFR